MKSIKVFGLAALAALMAMAFVGASSAMAGNTQRSGRVYMRRRPRGRAHTWKR